MSDPNAWQKESTDLDDPAISAYAIVPNDGADLPNEVRSIYVGADGQISVNMSNEGDNIVFVGLIAGTILTIRASRVNATGTTATNLVGLY